MNTTPRIVQWALQAPPGTRFMNQQGGDVVLLFAEGREVEIIECLERYLAHFKEIAGVSEGIDLSSDLTSEEEIEFGDEVQETRNHNPSQSMTSLTPPSALPVMPPVAQVIGETSHSSGAFPLPPPSRANHMTGNGGGNGILPQPGIKPPPPLLDMGTGPMIQRAPIQGQPRTAVPNTPGKARSRNPLIANVPRHTGKVPDNGIRFTKDANGRTIPVISGPVQVLPQPDILPPPALPDTSEKSSL